MLVDEILEQIKKDENRIFTLEKDFDNVINLIGNISFLGEIDYNNFYFEMLHQIRNKCEDEIKDLTQTEADEFYMTGNIIGNTGFEPFAWSYWYLNLEKKYVRVYVSYEGMNNNSPKVNYGLVYEKHNSKYCSYVPSSKIFKEIKIEESPHKEMWEKLITLIQYSKTNEISMGDYELKVHRNLSKFWGACKECDILDDKYKETSPPEIVKIPKKYEKKDLTTNRKILNVIDGASFLEVNFQNGYTIKYSTAKEALAWTYSIADYINNNDQYKQHIHLEKHYFNNAWTNNNSIEEMNQKRIENTKFELRICKFLDKVVIETEIAEFGICYTISNFWGNKIIEHF